MAENQVTMTDSQVDGILSQWLHDIPVRSELMQNRDLREAHLNQFEDIISDQSSVYSRTESEDEKFEMYPEFPLRMGLDQEAISLMGIVISRGSISEITVNNVQDKLSIPEYPTTCFGGILHFIY